MEMEQDRRARGPERVGEPVRAEGGAAWVVTSLGADLVAIVSARAAVQLPLTHGAYRAPPRSAPSVELE